MGNLWCGQTPTEKVSAKALYPPKIGGQWGGIAEPPAGASERSLSVGGAKGNAPVERGLPVLRWRGTEQPLPNEH